MPGRSLFVLLAAALVGCAGGAAETVPESTEGGPESFASVPAAVEGIPVPGADLQGGEPSGDGSPAGGGGLARPDPQRGIYLNAWAAGSAVRSRDLIELALRTEINTFVIDIKDASGFVSYPTAVSLAAEVGADREVRIRDVGALLARLEGAGIWPIARIVVFQDPIVARARPDMAVQDSLGHPWHDGRGDVWVNPWDHRVWDYHVLLAREAVELGFREIQWDYIRFPDRPASELAHAIFPGADGRSRAQAIREFLLYAREELADLGVPMTADVFGVTASATHDVGIGQIWEGFIDLVDVALPMVYPSHYWRGSFGIDEPNAHPYEIVSHALGHALRRTQAVEGSGQVIPWLQDFTLGAPPYGVAEVRAQIRATYDAGIESWFLWNASSRYTEGALEPVSGWPEGREPPIRIGGAVRDAASQLSPRVGP